MSSTNAPKADLYYSITLRRLWGTAGGESVPFYQAFSGGGGGSTIPSVVEEDVVNDVTDMDRKTDPARRIRGGPLPIHRYRIHTPERYPKFGRAAVLSPIEGGLSFGMFGRSGFMIHGRGRRGSDGCIVPARPEEFQALMDALTKSRGGTLTVWP